MTKSAQAEDFINPSPLEFLERMVREGLARLYDRMDRLEPLFVQLEQLNPIKSRQKRQLRFPDFEREKIKAILVLRFAPMLVLRVISFGYGARMPALIRKAMKIRLLLKEQCTPYESAFLQDSLRILEALIRGEKDRRRRLGGRCKTITMIVTGLATYLSQCEAFQRAPYSDAERYEYIGKIVQEVSMPRCLICRRVHSFPTWRNVKARDFYKGPWETRHLRGEHLGQPLGADYRLRKEELKMVDLLVEGKHTASLRTAFAQLAAPPSPLLPPLAVLGAVAPLLDPHA